MIDLGKLAVSLVVNGQDSAEKGLQSFGGKIEGLAKGGLKTIGTGLAAATTGLIAMGGAMFGMATKSAETGDRVDKLSQKIGLSRQSFQEYDFILSQSGASIEGLQGGMKTLTAQIDAVGEGNKKATANFERLGISVTDATGKVKSQEQVFEETVSALQGMEDGTEKARLATELFGRSGSELMPLLNGASGSIEEMKAKAHELGLVMGDDAIDAGVQFTDTMDQLKRSFGAVVAEVGVKVMPLIQQLLEWIIANMPAIQAVFEKVFGVIGTVMDIVVEHVQNFLGWLGTLLDGNSESGQKIAEVWEKVQEVFKIVFDTIGNFIKAFVEFAIGFWNLFGKDIMAFTKQIMDVVGAVFKGVFDFIIDVFKIFTALFKGDWKGLWDAIKNLFTNLWDNIKNILSSVLSVLVSAVKGFGNIIIAAWNLIWNGIKTIITNVWNSIVSWFGGAIQSVINIVTGIGSAMNNAGRAIFTSLWDGVKSIWSGIQSWISDKVSWISDKFSFFNSTGSKMKTDGSHRLGLNEVPYDGYIAELHKGEKLLTANEAQRYENGESGGGGKTTTNHIAPVFQINVSSGNPKEISRQIQKDLSLYNLAMG